MNKINSCLINLNIFVKVLARVRPPTCLL